MPAGPRIERSSAAPRQREQVGKPESGLRQQVSSAPVVAAHTASVVAASPLGSETTKGIEAVASPVPAPPSPTSPAPIVASERAIDGAALDAYAQILSAEIARQRRYPAVARMRGWQGTAVLAITLSPGGAVLKSALSRSSGYAVLDEQALKMVAEASPLPGAPTTLRGRALEFELPVVFTLAAS